MQTSVQRVRMAQAILVGLCAVFAALVGRLIYIQARMRPALLEWSERRQTSVIPLAARRGSIMDRRHRVLAGSQNLPCVYADPRLIGDHAEAAGKLAEPLQLFAEAIQKLLDNPTSPGYVVLKRGVDKDALQAIDDLDLRGINTYREPTRTYSMGPLAAHVIGFVGSDDNGLEGLELAFDKYLRGTPGRRVVFCDGRRKALFQAPDSYQSPRDGMHLVLTIDAAIQEVVEREVKKVVDHFQAQSGLGMMMNPRTGEILAMSCCPEFLPAAAGKYPPEVRRNRILTDPVEPGSVFKPFVMSAALAAGVTKPTETIYCHGGLYVCGKRMLHDSHPHGNLTTAEIVTKSSNIGMAIVGQRLGNHRMFTALHALGFGHATGIDLPGESAGLMMPFKDWNSYTTTSVPMGQEIAVTPLQILTAFCALVNGGHLMRPRVVTAVLDQPGDVVEDHSEPKDGGQVVNPQAAAMMHEILVQVVNEGTGKGCQLGRWQVMGKTGTAQVPRSDRKGYEPDAYLSSFIAAAPASDPQVAVLVMVRKPKKSIAYYGAQVSAPAVKAILEQTLPYLNVPPDKTPSASGETKLALDARD